MVSLQPRFLLISSETLGLLKLALSIIASPFERDRLFFRMALSRRVGKTFFGRLRSQIFSRNIIYG